MLRPFEIVDLKFTFFQDLCCALANRHGEIRFKYLFNHFSHIIRAKTFGPVFLLGN